MITFELRLHHLEKTSVNGGELGPFSFGFRIHFKRYCEINHFIIDYFRCNPCGGGTVQVIIEVTLWFLRRFATTSATA